jgi:glycosyltransferase
MKVSIITAAFNSEDTIGQCMESVRAQTHGDLEHIVVDGGSQDGTLDIIRKYRGGISKWVSEPDRGIYHALNKGIGMSSGEVIGFLHSDDMYAHEKVVEKVVASVAGHESCYGDLTYVGRDNPERIIRYWKSRPYSSGLFHRGWMPPHPTFFVRKKIYDKFGLFNTGFRIAADYELMLRFIEREGISTCYIPEVLVKMRTGGASSGGIGNQLLKTYEDYKAWKTNGLRSSGYTIFMKKISKVPQFLKRCPNDISPA